MSEDGNNVVFLKFRSPNVEEGTMDFITCRYCRNKTYTLIDEPSGFPLMRCAACQQHMGHMGWAEEFPPSATG